MNKKLVVAILAVALFLSIKVNNADAQTKSPVNTAILFGQNTQETAPTDEVTKKYDFDLAQELVLGRTVSYGLLEKFNNKINTDEKANHYVNLVGQSLVKAASTRPMVKYKFGILDSPEINAFAAPGGYVFITSGLFSLLENENQLAAVLAHEIGHIEHGDGMQDYNTSNKDRLAKAKSDELSANAGAVSDVVTSLPYAGWYASYYSPKALARRGVSNAMGHVPGWGGYFASMAVGTATDAAFDATVSGLKALSKKIAEAYIKRWYYKPLSPEIEYAADEFSVKALSKAGYDPYGMASFLEQLRVIEEILGTPSTVTTNKGSQNVFSYTHPSTQSRVDKAKSEATGLPGTDKMSLPEFTSRFKENITVQ